MSESCAASYLEFSLLDNVEKKIFLLLKVRIAFLRECIQRMLDRRVSAKTTPRGSVVLLPLSYAYVPISWNWQTVDD